jgi:lysophospholipase L1-like esterase
MKFSAKNINPKYELKKRFLLGIITITLPLIIILVFELMLRGFNYGGNTDLFITAPDPYENYNKINPAVAERYFFRQTTVPVSSNDIFLIQKPADSYRIFVLGGSTALGFPYGNMLMFSRILNRRLQDTFPGRNIEVVNASLTAVNSYTLLDFIDEILEQDPDLILIYSGHNEYYGALGVSSMESTGIEHLLASAYLKLNRLKIFQLLRDFIFMIAGSSQDIQKGNGYNPSGTLMERLVTEENIEYGSGIYDKGKLQFEKNLKAIYKKAGNANVPILISELVSNISGMKPFTSNEKTGQQNAAKIFEAAQQHEIEGAFDIARQEYYRAKDLDGLRFRAPEIFNEIIHRVANDFHQPVVPMKMFFEGKSKHGLIGNNLMVDHLHPNIDGYFLMADAFYETIKFNKFIVDSWNPKFINSGDFYRSNWPVTELNTAVGYLMIKHLKSRWPFTRKSEAGWSLLDYKPENLIESLALKVIFNELGMDEAHYILAKHYEKENSFRLRNREYDALTHYTFIEAYSYLSRGQSYMRAGEFNEALALFEESLKHEDIPLARELINEINLQMDNSSETIISMKQSNM